MMMMMMMMMTTTTMMFVPYWQCKDLRHFGYLQALHHVLGDDCHAVEGNLGCTEPSE